MENTEVQPFSQRFCTTTLSQMFQIGLFDPAGADLVQFRTSDSLSGGVFRERL